MVPIGDIFSTSTRPPLTAVKSHVWGDVDEVVGRMPAVMQQLAQRTARRWADDADAVELVGDLFALDGGKYLRPRLLSLAYFGLGGHERGVAESLSCAVQCLHLGLCVHDDLLDDDEIRHQKPTVHHAATVRLGAQDHRQGMASAVLAGDLAIAVAVEEVVAVAPALPVGALPTLVRELTGAVQAAVAGELADVRGEIRPLGAGRPARIAELKTASYSTVLPLRMGAVAAGASLEVLATLSTVGTHLGVAYQWSDDDLGVFGNPAVTGKSAGSDLISGKRTELMRLAMAAANDEQRQYLTRWVGAEDLDASRLDSLRTLLVELGARRALQDQIDEHTSRAVAAAETLPASLAGALTALATSLITRDR